MKRTEYNIVVQEQSKKLYAYALHFLRNSEDAHDIVQEVYEKMWIHRKKVEFEKAKAWMFTTAHNAMINFVQKKQRLALTNDMSHFEKGISKMHLFESKEVVLRAVSILPPVQKSIILLRDLEGYSYQEIGQILNLSDAQVKVYLFRGRNKIKKQLKGLKELV